MQPEDLLKFGFIPELIGRFPVLAPLNGLSKEALYRVLTEPRNALVKQYRKLFAMEGVDLEFDRRALDAIIALAVERGSGARSLRAIMEDTLRETMYDMPDKTNLTKVVITEETVSGAPPLYISAERKAA